MFLFMLSICGVVVLMVQVHYLWMSPVQVYFEDVIDHHGGNPRECCKTHGLFTACEQKADSCDEDPYQRSCPIKGPGVTD